MSTLPPTEAPWAAGLRGARANIVPGLVLQIFALTLVVTYYFVPGIASSLTALTDFRDRTGFGYSVVATATFGGILPYLYLRFNPSTRTRYTFGQGMVIAAFWGYKGIEVDLLYQSLAWAVGSENTASVIAIKTVIDQFVYNPVIAIPSIWLFYQWVEHRFNWGEVWTRVRVPGWYGRDLLPLMISNFGVWCPAVIIIYSLPTPLQLPLQNIVLCFFTLIIAYLSQKRAA